MQRQTFEVTTLAFGPLVDSDELAKDKNTLNEPCMKPVRWRTSDCSWTDAVVIDGLRNVYCE